MPKHHPQDKARLRELATQTLEAYRSLNTVAAEASFAGNSDTNGEGLNRAGKLLETVIAELKTTTNGSDG